MMRIYFEGWVGYLYFFLGDGDRVFIGFFGYVFILEGFVFFV